jgi:uncharacterized OsmC-like protein
MAANELVTSVVSTSSGVVDRSLNSAGRHCFVIDGHTVGEEIGSLDAFLAGISSCGVNNVERYAQQTGVPLRRIEVTIDGVRDRAAPSSFSRVDMRFVLTGVDEAQAKTLVANYTNT